MVVDGQRVIGGRGLGLAALGMASGAAGWLRFRRGLLARAEEERQRAELMVSRFHAAVDGAPVGVTLVGLDGRVKLVNDRLRELLRTPPDGELSILHYYDPADHEDVLTTIDGLLSGRVDRLVRERQLVRHDGTRLWCRISTSSLRDADGQPAGIVAHIQDIEAERAAVEELRSKTRWFSSILGASSDLITLFDVDGIATWVSPSVGALLGRAPAELLGQPILAFIHRDDRAHVQLALDGLREGRPARAEYRVRGPNRDWIWLESTASSLLDDPDVRGIIAVSRDVTERHRTTEVLAHRAAHDPLTGLANRAELEHRLQSALHHAMASGEPLSVAYLDVDGFKPVNDSHGHAAGDDLLRCVAEVLRAQVRDGDLIARVGGDEFVVVLPGVDRSAARATAERIRLQLGQPMAIEGPAEPVQVTASIGLAWAVEGHTVASLLRDADQALYEAKRRGRDRIEVARGEVDPRDLVDELIKQATATSTGPG